ncbi:hypothetical protein VM57_15445 [Stenotrophomonas maltophilia]|uniref:Transmembrane protein n=1 Tax=Stenotrophomonas maltophilia TaxID=40324 RepID=A0A0F5ZMQ1_STEMA|nr:hypothetical protein VM57_15445 [Stenotrophomonas maltophilia]
MQQVDVSAKGRSSLFRRFRFFVFLVLFLVFLFVLVFFAFLVLVVLFLFVVLVILDAEVFSIPTAFAVGDEGQGHRGRVGTDADQPTAEHACTLGDQVGLGAFIAQLFPLQRKRNSVIAWIS